MGTLKKSFSSGTAWVSPKRQKRCRIIEFTLKPTGTEYRDFNCVACQGAAREIFGREAAAVFYAIFHQKNSLAAACHAAQLKSRSTVPVGLRVNSIIRASFLPFWRDSSGTTGEAFFQGSHKTRCLSLCVYMYLYICISTSIHLYIDIGTHILDTSSPRVWLVY